MDKYKLDGHKLNYHIGRLNDWLEGSLDDKSYVKVANVRQEVIPPNKDEWLEWSFENQKAFRYYRLLVLSGHGVEIVTFSELELRGPEGKKNRRRPLSIPQAYTAVTLALKI